MRISDLASATLAAAALGLAGCAGGVGGPYDTLPSSQTYYENSFSGSEIGYATQFGAVPVSARGGALDDRRNQDVLVDVLNRNPVSSQLRFVPAGGPSSTSYSVIFAPGQMQQNVNYCDGRTAVPASSGGAQLSGAFCLGGRLRSSGWVNLPGSDLSAPPARAAVNTLVTALFSADRGRGRGRVFE